MSFKSFIAATALTVATATAAHAGVLTTTVTGTISNVNASNGYFNNIQVGQAFTYTSVFDLSTAQVSGQNNVDYYYGNTYSYLNASTSTLLSAQLTVNGQAVSFAHGFKSANIGMTDYSRIGYQDYWNSNVSGNNYNYNNYYYNGYSYEYADMGANVNAYGISGGELDLGKTYTHTFAPGEYANFWASTGHYEYNYYNYYGNYNSWYASLNGQIETFSFNAANDVPEPGSLALMAFGLFAVGAARRRKMSR